jgi:hypothetical protein
VAVQVVDQRLDRRLLQVTQVRGGLSWRDAEHHQLSVDQAESVDHDLE